MVPRKMATSLVESALTTSARKGITKALGASCANAGSARAARRHRIERRRHAIMGKALASSLTESVASQLRHHQDERQACDEPCCPRFAHRAKVPRTRTQERSWGTP